MRASDKLDDDILVQKSKVGDGVPAVAQLSPMPIGHPAFGAPPFVGTVTTDAARVSVITWQIAVEPSSTLATSSCSQPERRFIGSDYRTGTYRSGDRRCGGRQRPRPQCWTRIFTGTQQSTQAIEVRATIWHRGDADAPRSPEVRPGRTRGLCRPVAPGASGR